jgi:hypothetical protein
MRLMVKARSWRQGGRARFGLQLVVITDVVVGRQRCQQCHDWKICCEQREHSLIQQQLLRGVWESGDLM